MGGPDSGTQYRWNGKTTMEETRRIDIRFLKRRGWLVDRPDQVCSGTLSWASRGEQNGFINAKCYHNRLELDYRYRENGGDWMPIKQTILLESTACHYGGHRKWLSCPQCHSRVGILCGAGKLFLCRNCYQLPYRSQMEGGIDRLISQKHKLGDKIFENFDGDGYRKRKGMHQKTFDRLLTHYLEIEGQINASMYGRYLALQNERL